MSQEDDFKEITVDTFEYEENLCLMRKIELVTEFLFDLPKKESSYGM